MPPHAQSIADTQVAPHARTGIVITHSDGTAGNVDRARTPPPTVAAEARTPTTRATHAVGSSSGTSGGGEHDDGTRYEPTDLDVPYKEKDAAKALGAEWDAERSKWFVPPCTALAPFRRWLVEARTYLRCPYREKDEAKDLGAKYDSERQLWYAPGDLDVTTFRKWLA